MVNKNTFQVLHISDLHIKNDENEKFDRSIVLDPMIERIRKDRIREFSPEIVVVTGDIAFHGVSTEYSLAKLFFDDLLTELELSSDRLFIVPGNHDVNRGIYRPTDIPVYETVKDLNNEYGNKQYRENLLMGMHDYFEFIKNNYPHLSGINDGSVPFVNTFNTDSGKNIGLAGLNSAWMCRKSKDANTIALGEYQVKTADAALKDIGVADCRIYLFHHPLEWLWQTDKRRCGKYFDNCVLLCGHLHDSAGGYNHDYDARLFQFQAGGAYLGSESVRASRFQFVSFDWGNRKIRLDFRKFAKYRGIWILDAETGDDGVKIFDMPESKREKNANKIIFTDIPLGYKGWVENNCSYMDVEHLQAEGKPIRLDLPEVFIPLYAHEPGENSKGDALHADRKEPVEVEMQVRKEPVDVEKLIGKNEYLLIEGEAGSGKTTLLKHLTYGLAREDYQTFQQTGLRGYLPVLIFLKDLNGLFTNAVIKRGRLSAKDILSFYFQTFENVLDFKIIDRFCKKGKALFLLDGLDEISPENRKMVVNAFANYQNKRRGNKIVFSGRSHGVAGPAMDIFGENHVRILPLSIGQVALFINRWFQFIEPKSSGTGLKTAEAMISEIREHEAIEELIENPLLLTATCILYNDGKRLPGQRAELYKKFINNLLCRRFDKPEKVYDFLMTLAFQMHEKKTRGVDKIDAVNTLQSIYIKRNDESGDEYRSGIDKLFYDIESGCGLLKLAKSQFNFNHLSFQAFLTAVYLVKKHTDYGNAINLYWDDEWYYEAIGLYIGYLSIDNREWANKIVEDALKKDDTEPFARWRLAAKSLLDMQRDTRKIDLLDLATDKLKQIIKSEIGPKILADAGETLGRLGDTRDLESFISIKGGSYPLKRGKVLITPFKMSKYPVTNQWYSKFMNAEGYDNFEFWSKQGIKWLSHTGVKHPEYWHNRKWNCPNSPVVGVSWWEADAFCRWLTSEKGGGAVVYRLPTENEWEAAAAGFKTREYPFGTWKNGVSNTDESDIGKISPVGIFQGGKTPEGIFDMTGNVWEWTTTNYDREKNVEDFTFDPEIQSHYDKGDFSEAWDLAGKKKNRPSLRGGCWNVNRNFARCAFRLRLYPYDRIFYVGFRCVRTKT